MRRSGLWLLLILIVPLATPALASWQSCAGQPIDQDAIRCPDGSIPNFEYGDPPIGAQPGHGSDASSAAAAMRFPWVGVWHTEEPGLGQSRADDIPGASTLDTKAGLRAGDLTLAPNGAFIWNRMQATWGRWIEASPPWDIVMYDSSGTKRWRARIEQGRLRLEQGDTITYGTR